MRLLGPEKIEIRVELTRPQVYSADGAGACIEYYAAGGRQEFRTMSMFINVIAINVVRLQSLQK